MTEANTALALTTPQATSAVATSPRVQTALERRYLKTILNLNPGMGERAHALAGVLADSGLTPGQVAMFLGIVYRPSDPVGRGQSTRAKWFVAAVQDRYGSRLEKVKTDLVAFKSFVADLEQINDMRDTLNGEGLSVSYHAAMLMAEMGLDADAVMTLVEQYLDQSCGRRLFILGKIIRAIQAVKAGKCATIETALETLGYE